MAKLVDIVKKTFRRAILPFAILSSVALAQDYNVHGTIRDMNGQASGSVLQNVKVEADSGKNVAFTDINGNYSLHLPSGNHNLRIVKSDKRGWQQNYTINSDTTLNFSLPDTVQNIPMGSSTLKTFDIKESYTNEGSLIGGNGGPAFWKTLPVPIFITGATHLDSLTFKQYISSGTGDLAKINSDSAEWAMQRPLFIFTADSINAANNGYVLTCNGNTNGTSVTGEIVDGKFTGYIQNAQSVLGPDPVAFQHELLGFGFDKHYVFSRVSNMNGAATTTWTNIDNLITWVGENYKLSRLRGENAVDLFSMLDYYPSMLSQPSITKNSQSLNGNSVNTSIAWTPIFDVDHYSLEIATDSLFTNVVFNNSSVQQDSQIVSLNPATKHFVRVNAMNSKGTTPWSVIYSFTTVPPVPQSPSIVQPINNSTNQPTSVTAKWNSVPFAANYHLQFGKDSTFATTDLDTIMVDTLKAFSNLQNNKKYFMRVNASNASGTGASANSNFTTIPALPGDPVIVTPSNNSINQPINPVMKWSKIAGSTGYHAQLSIDSLFQSTVVDTALVDTVLQFVNLLNSQKYFGRVNSQNAAGNSPYSNVTFTTIVALPGLPALVSPANYATNQPTNLTLSWNKGSNANSTEVQLGTDSTFATTLKDTSLSNTSLNVSGLQNSIKYFWRAKSNNVAGSSNFTDSWRFTTINQNHAPLISKALRDTVIYEDNPEIILSTNVRQNIVDPDGDTLSYSVSGANGIGIKLSGDTLKLNPFKLFYGNGNPVILVATDSHGLSISDTAYVNVIHVNHPPSTFALIKPVDNDTIKYNNITIPISWTKATDVDGDSLTYLINFKGNGVDTTISTKDTSATIPSSILSPSSVYTIDAKVKDNATKSDTTSATNTKIVYTASKLTDVVKSDSKIPKDFELMQNYPNPFNPTTTITYSIPKTSTVHLDVYNILGQAVQTLVDQELPPGDYKVTFPDFGRYQKLSSGVYFYRIDAMSKDNNEHHIMTKKMLLTK